MPKEVKKKRRFVAKCIYAPNCWCWQQDSYAIREWKKPYTEECPACLIARTNWGESALIRPLNSEEARALREKVD